MSRCRICSANDRQALILDMAIAMWDTQKTTDTHTDWEPWEEASPFWQKRMLEFAEGSLRAIERSVANPEV
jgi:hypothetical protein